MAHILMPPEIGWLALLLVMWAALLFGGYSIGRPAQPHGRRMPAWTRLASSAVLVVAAWSWSYVVWSSQILTFALLVGIGMLLGALGDLLMAGVVPGVNRIVGGLAAFGLGHVSYIIGVAWLANRFGLDAPAPLLLGWLGWLAIGVLGWYLVVFRRHSRTTLHWVSLPYSLLLASTTGLATGLALQDPRFVVLAVGAGFFFFSDLMIAAAHFGHLSLRSLAVDDLIWLTYGPGQMLIVYSTWVVVR